MKNKISVFALIICVFMFFSCVSTSRDEKTCSRVIYDYGVKNQDSLASFFMDHNSLIKKEKVYEFASLYIEECEAEGINSDVAFVQMCLETGFLRFGNLVTMDMNNFCGLGSIDSAHPGETFPDVRSGIRAHVQHLHAYGTTADVKLNNTLIDRRYKYVNPRGKAPTVFELAGTWASDRSYGTKLDSLLSKLEQY